MFRISHVLGTHREHDRRASPRSRPCSSPPSPTSPTSPTTSSASSPQQTTRTYPTILLTAHGPGDKVMGFALADHFEWLGYAYLDFIVTQADQRGRGLGGGLYEALRQDLMARGAKGLFLEVPTDDPKQVADPESTSRRTRTGSNSTSGTTPGRSSTPSTTSRSAPASPPSPACSTTRSTTTTREAEDAREVMIAAILTLRYNYATDSGYVVEVVASVKDSPVKIRKPIYASPEEKKYKIPGRLHPLKVFCSARHSLHHVRERGYVERPARVDVILKAIDDLPDVERLPVRNFGEGPIRAVHDADFVNYRPRICARSCPPGSSSIPTSSRSAGPTARPTTVERPRRAITASTPSRP